MISSRVNHETIHSIDATKKFKTEIVVEKT
jgi:hypothetical protein